MVKKGKIAKRITATRDPKSFKSKHQHKNQKKGNVSQANLPKPTPFNIEIPDNSKREATPFMENPNNTKKQANSFGIESSNNNRKETAAFNIETPNITKECAKPAQAIWSTTTQEARPTPAQVPPTPTPKPTIVKLGLDDWSQEEARHKRAESYTHMFPDRNTRTRLLDPEKAGSLCSTTSSGEDKGEVEEEGVKLKQRTTQVCSFDPAKLDSSTSTSSSEDENEVEFTQRKTQTRVFSSAKATTQTLVRDDDSTTSDTDIGTDPEASENTIPQEFNNPVENPPEGDEFQIYRDPETGNVLFHKKSGFQVTDEDIREAQDAGFEVRILERKPNWYPSQINKILCSPRCPDTLPYNVSGTLILQISHPTEQWQALDKLTIYRQLLEKYRRQRWKRYNLCAGQRLKFNIALNKERRNPRSPAALRYLRRELTEWKKLASHTCYDLDVVQHGIRYLDGIIDQAWQIERKIYEDQLPFYMNG